jgi:hypothetical protein
MNASIAGSPGSMNVSIVGCIIACILATVSLSAHATTYRCEIDGRTLYSDVPCSVGRQAMVSTDDRVSEADRAAAAARLRSDKATLSQVERDRARERMEELHIAELDRRRALDAAKRGQTCANLARRARNAHDTFDLAGPRDQAKARLKMQRADEDYAARCRR